MVFKITWDDDDDDNEEGGEGKGRKGGEGDKEACVRDYDEMDNDVGDDNDGDIDAIPMIKTRPLWHDIKSNSWGTSLVVQWLRIHLPVQGTWVPSLVEEDPACFSATKPVCRNCWASALECVLCNKRSHRSEKLSHRSKECLPLTAAGQGPCRAMKTQRSQK